LIATREPLGEEYVICGVVEALDATCTPELRPSDLRHPKTIKLLQRSTTGIVANHYVDEEMTALPDE